MPRRNWGWVGWSLTAMALGAGGLALPAARASSPPGAQLSSASAVVRWSGSTPLAYAPPVHTPATCPVAAQAGACDTFSLEVALPPGTFTHPGDGVFVAIRWATDFDQWNLYVYDASGSLVASGFQLDSNAQAVLIPHPANGVYQVVAVPFYQEAQRYRGEASVFLDDTQRLPAGTPILPQLQTVPPFDLHVACAQPDPTSSETGGGCTDVPPIPSNPTGWRFGGGFTNSCYLDETAGAQVAGPGRPPLRCLRFSNDIRNVGTGPLRMRLRAADAAAGIGSAIDPARSGCQMTQVIARAGGGEQERPGGSCTFHAAHGHFHYQGLGSYALYDAPADATTPPNLAAVPRVRGSKVGYCLVDVDYWADPATSTAIWPRTYSFPTCNAPTAQSASSSSFQEMGISRGWGDVYTWDLPGQFVDITGVPDGVYDLVSIANPDCKLAEQGGGGREGAATRIRLSGSTVTTLATFGPFPVPGCTPPSA